MKPSSASTALIRPQAVVFDLGKVLVDFDYHRAARALSPHSRLAPDDFRNVIDQSPLLYRYESGQLTSEGFEAEVRRLTGYTGFPEHFRGAFGDIFTEMPDMIALQQELRRQQVPIYLFSNTNEIAVNHIRRRFPFLGTFDGLVLSYEIGAMKPEPESYAAVERLTGLQGSALLYLDDRSDNIAGGAARGWQAILHESPAVSRAEVLRRLGA